MRERGQPFSALHAFLAGLYRPMEWEPMGSRRTSTLPLAHLPADLDTAKVRPGVPEDAETLRGLYERPAARYRGAELLDIPVRTLRAWIRQGKVPVLAPTEGSRGVRLSDRTLEELRQAKPITWDGERFLRQSGGHPASEQQHGSGVPAEEQQASGTAACQPEDPAALPAARFYKDLLTGVERERDQALREVDHLRAQLKRRDEEINRWAIAEEQLRVMLMKLEAANAELAGALVVKALPPAPEVVETPKRTRWWQLWR
jgi:hypothetical protein